MLMVVFFVFFLLIHDLFALQISNSFITLLIKIKFDGITSIWGKIFLIKKCEYLEKKFKKDCLDLPTKKASSMASTPPPP